jgi:ADP-dependent NAD(P)H-hydrate dehydratase
MHPSPPGDGRAITPALLRSWPLPLPREGDKLVRGTVLVVGGSEETPGAVMLAGLAALRSGAGKLQIATSPVVAAVVAAAVPEALVTGWPPLTGAPPSAWDPVDRRLPRADAVIIGPGASSAVDLPTVVAHVFEHVNDHAVVVLDAHAISAATEVPPALLAGVGRRVVITPNPGEARALDPSLGEDAAVEALAAGAARRIGGVATVNGAVACADGRCWSAGTGSIGLGTSGSGDVLAGIVAGVAARCHDAAQAACWAAHLHGTAGDRLAAAAGPVGYLARELLDQVPRVLAEVS